MSMLYSSLLAVVGPIVTGALVYLRMLRHGKGLAVRLQQSDRDSLEAQIALQSQGRLAKEVAHELKNPISAIACAADTLQFLLQDRLDECENRILRHIKENGEYVAKLMGDFIDISKGATGYLNSSKETLCVGEVIDSVVGLLESAAVSKQVSIEVVACSNPAWVEADPKHLKQILFNLIHNAIKFTPAGGDVRVSFGVGPDSECVSIEVSDTGVGICADEIDKLFDPVWRLQQGGEAGGSGLGLALTKTLVNLEAGHISVFSSQDQGSTFRVILARAPAPEIIDSILDNPIDLVASRPLSGQSVLVVNPDPVVRETLQRVIEKLGGAVDGVSMAVEALEAVHSTRYSAVVIDEIVDSISGCEVAQMVRKDLPFGQGRVFIASAKPVDEKSCREIGVDGCIEKPYAPKSVLDKLMDG
jgi:two-component system sensor histidine kinase EvgS